MKIKKIFFRWGLVLLFPLAIVLVHIAKNSPETIEKYYSSGVYPFIGQCLSNVTRIIPISIAELIIVLVPLFILYRFIKMVVQLIRSDFKDKWNILLNYIRKMFVYISVGYFLFIIVWGLNYHRLPFSEIAGLDTRKASETELAELCESLIIKANNLRTQVTENDEGIMYVSGGHGDIFKRAHEGFINASAKYSELGGKYGRAKGVVFSNAMSYLGIGGMYFPFTGEANININKPDPLLPATTTHEMAHQRGFAREDEANYIAYLTCVMHPDTDFKYSGTLLALIYSMNKLKEYDKGAYKQLRSLYSAGVLRDLENNNEFWQRYSGPIDDASTKLNNAYLKSNIQTDGVHSYGRMVDLLIAEYRLSDEK